MSTHLTHDETHMVIRALREYRHSQDKVLYGRAKRSKLDDIDDLIDKCKVSSGAHIPKKNAAMGGRR